MRTDKLTAADIAQWIDNDEGLYSWWRSERPRLSKREFIRANRAELERCIRAVLDGTKRAHFLRYG